MNKIEQLRQQVERYEEMLAVVKRPAGKSQEDVAERLLSRLLFETTNKLKALEQNAVKIHRRLDADMPGLGMPGLAARRRGARGSVKKHDA